MTENNTLTSLGDMLDQYESAEKGIRERILQAIKDIPDPPDNAIERVSPHLTAVSVSLSEVVKNDMILAASYYMPSVQRDSFLTAISRTKSIRQLIMVLQRVASGRYKQFAYTPHFQEHAKRILQELGLKEDA